MILPDANLLIAFTWDGHENYPEAEALFAKYPKVATCPITELAMVRVWMQKGATAIEADKALKDFVSKHRSKLIADTLSATEIAGFNTGHRQTTGTYLAKLAAAHGLKLITLDVELADRLPELVELWHG